MFEKKIMSRRIVQGLLTLSLLLALILPASSIEAAEEQIQHKKRELRAAWIATVFNIDWPVKGASADEQKKQFISILDDVKSMGMNAVVVQVRPTSDAFYPSKYGPWSEYLTGTQGKNPGYDPLAFMVEEAHKRNLEFHAWVNPYRITTTHQDVNKLVANHPAKQNPDWVVKHGKQLLYNPGIPAVRDYVKNSVLEIVQNYDVDAIHMDDYFYPYADAKNFNDATAYETYGKGKNKDDWRRENVNTLVHDLSTSIKQTKSHVKFGISPFGIWRNQQNDTQGSATKGLSAYDAIYADSRLWMHKEWVDYLTPQVYWSRSLKVANYDVLTKWWNNEAQGKRTHLYIGQAAYNINNSGDKAWENPDEMINQLALNSTLSNIKGSIFFSYKDLKNNKLGIKDRLRENAYKYAALVPTMPWLDNAAPSNPSGIYVTDGSNGATISWNNNAGKEAAYFVIYRFNKGQLVDVNDSSAIVTTIRNNGSKAQSYVDKVVMNSGDYTYAVSAVDRLHNESELIAVKDDITGGWYEKEIRQLADRGIMLGEGNGNYYPNRLVTRAEFATLITRALQLPSGNASFTDLGAVHPSLRDGINRASSAGIIIGRGDNTFDPNATITREEAVIMIDRSLKYAGVKEKSVELPFVDKDSVYAREELQRVYGYGIVKGDEHNQFAPKGSAQRAHAAAFINRMLKCIEGN
ncbi:family 10 glycosylhydrolase [Bacillus cereus]|uniref:family 10 glycosylhydrolase n=1 Tax=Bacillus cereus TaxID=1396 RepID=UPI00211D313B|nr:family 10 glycosylhydrolase [Bacillus cereus]